MNSYVRHADTGESSRTSIGTALDIWYLLMPGLSECLLFKSLAQLSQVLPLFGQGFLDSLSMYGPFSSHNIALARPNFDVSALMLCDNHALKDLSQACFSFEASQLGFLISYVLQATERRLFRYRRALPARPS